MGGGKRKREDEPVAQASVSQGISETSGDGQKPAKRRKKVKKKKIKAEEVELNEESFIRILRENNGRMDFGKLLKRFRNISHEENKALVRSLRDRLCNPLEAVGKKKFFISLKKTL